jgi:hypothetical protein
LSSNKNIIDGNSYQILKPLITQMISKCFFLTSIFDSYYYIYNSEDNTISVSLEEYFIKAYKGISYKQEKIEAYISDEESESSYQSSESDCKDSQKEVILEKQSKKISKKSA